MSEPKHQKQCERSIAARWVRLGVMLNVRAARDEVDLEHLLLDTARGASENSRLLILAVTWLARHGRTVAKHRLTQLIRIELEAEFQPVMGLMLDLARAADKSNRTRFNRAIAACQSAATARPLATVECSNRTLWKLSEKRASEISRRWSRWFESFDLKHDALRDDAWIFEKNPWLRERALAGGELVVSVLAEIRANDGPVPSESELANRLGASRPAVRVTLQTLERAGCITIHSMGNAHQIDLAPAA